MKKPFCDICEKEINDSNPPFDRLSIDIVDPRCAATLSLDFTIQPDEADFCTKCIREKTVEAFENKRMEKSCEA